ncbi:hypothetical protein [uncultured Prevotella sp.]|uniref:hypothetical protein n=1 Tax=uncultured Prevotella sp. TaxID=159272 RepID=UPI002636402D|nr:hypothetical protein [uncultured Prevotella sp.]
MKERVIDFFKDETPVGYALFGICDDEDEAAKTPAYVDADEKRKEKWTAVVANKSGKIISFIAVDNKIEIRRENGQMENRCDAMLHNDEYIVFIELKDQGKEWIKHAVEDQLATTINVFKQCHDISLFKHKLAFACNRRHRTFAFSQKEYMQRFRNLYGVRLNIECNIMIK